VIALVSVLLWQSRERRGPPVRLAVLPLVVDGASGPRLPMELPKTSRTGSRLSAAIFWSYLPARRDSNRVDSPAKAKAVLAPLHVLRTRLASSGGQITALASVIDTASGQV